MKTRKRKGKIHCVYESVEEFRSHNPDTSLADSWREAKEGEWVEADDGGVVQILKRGELPHPHDRKNYSLSTGWVRTIVGTFPCNAGGYMDTDFDQHPQPYTFSRRSAKEQARHQKERKNLSKAEHIFVTSIMAGKTLQQSYEEAWGPTVDWRERAIARLKQERIVKMLNKNVEEIAEKIGLDYEYIMKKLMLLAENSENDNVILGSLKELKEWLPDTKLKQVTSGQLRVFQPFSDKEILEIEAERVEALESGDE